MMWKRILILGVFLGLAVAAAPPAESGCSYHYSYDNSRAGSYNGTPVCWSSGGGCTEYGTCDGSSYCTEDKGGGASYCLDQQEM